ncbi:MULTISPECIES: hypothetical protein [unclassified Lactococcus]|uniref:hypothetical protein n=1 Tax=unclassified Lactococcus TaxID=2643510 RepID=UPI0011C81C43|nr:MULTISPECIES: hypothetical protein [unclassified Lactococcus]MQW23906.1 hypothetical protein [Lactococcus sp. dk101]TXK37134.1 hypothetical protein FVP42_09800 [Lactococcus sp. dk310]TXK47988.1 hypothetical protein FVP43_09525 [Lactococcus sp. dk322]
MNDKLCGKYEKHNFKTLHADGNLFVSRCARCGHLTTLFYENKQDGWNEKNIIIHRHETIAVKALNEIVNLDAILDYEKIEQFNSAWSIADIALKRIKEVDK